MSEEGDIFTDLLSGLMPPPTKAEINEEDDVEVLVVKPTSMNELRSAKYQEENGEMVAVKRSSSPIGVGLAPPPPPLTKCEMEDLVSELLRAKLLESMGALTNVLRTCFQKLDNRLLGLNEKCEDINSKVEELACEQTKSSEYMEKAMNAVSQSLRETGVGLQRVLDKQELVDAHVLLSKLGKDNAGAQEDLRVRSKTHPSAKVIVKGKDPGDTGGPSEPNPPSPVPNISAPQLKQEGSHPSQQETLPVPPPVPHTAVQPAPILSPTQVSPPQQVPPVPPPQQGAMLPVVTAPGLSQAPQLAYSQPTSSEHQIPQPYEVPAAAETPPMDPQHHVPPQPTVPFPPPAQQPLPQGSFPPQAYSLPSQPPQITPSPQGQQQPLRVQQAAMIPGPPPPGPQQMPQWKPAPPQPPTQRSAYPPPPSGQYGQPQIQMPPQQQHFQPPVVGTGPPPPVGGMGYPQHPQGLSSRQPPGQSQQPQAPPNPIYGAPPPMMSTHGSSGLQSPGVSARTSNQSVPLDKVIDDVASMGFDRTKVRSVVTEMINQGKSVDLNVVIDRLSSM